MACLSKTPDMGRCERNHHHDSGCRKGGNAVKSKTNSQKRLVHSILTSDEYTETIPRRLERRVYIRLPLAADDDQRREPKAK